MLADDSCIKSADNNLSYMQSQVCFAFVPHSVSITTTTTTINIFVIIVIISSIITVNSLRKRRHFAMPPLVPLRNDVSGTSAEIPYWWCVTIQIWVVLLIARAEREICFDQSEAPPRSRQWHVISMDFCACFSDVTSRGSQWCAAKCYMSQRLHRYHRHYHHNYHYRHHPRYYYYYKKWVLWINVNYFVVIHQPLTSKLFLVRVNWRRMYSYPSIRSVEKNRIKDYYFSTWHCLMILVTIALHKTVNTKSHVIWSLVLMARNKINFDRHFFPD